MHLPFEMSLSGLQSQECLLFLVAGLIAVGAFTLIQVLRYLYRDPMRAQIAAITGQTPPAESATARQFADALAAQLPQSKAESNALERDLRRAGHYSPRAKREFQAVRNALVLGAILLTGMALVWLGPEREAMVPTVLIAGSVVCVLSWAIPRLILKSQGNRRARRVQAGLPDALDLMSMCLTGGLSLHDTFLHVCQEIVYVHPDLAIELMIIRQQSEMTSLDVAFSHLAKRLDSQEVVSLSTLLMHSQRLGTDMVAAIRDFADSMRLKRRQLADEYASKVSLRLLFPLVLCLMPAACILLWGPAVLQLKNFLSTFAIPH